MPNHRKSTPGRGRTAEPAAGKMQAGDARHMVPQAAGSPHAKPAAARTHQTLTAMMEEISRCRADLAARESLISGLERRLDAELMPLEEKIRDVRIDTFRVLGGHLRSGRLDRRACRNLEAALLDLADALECEYGIDLSEDRNRFFEPEYPPEMDGEDSGDPGDDDDEEREGFNGDPAYGSGSARESGEEPGTDRTQCGWDTGSGARSRRGGGRSEGSGKGRASDRDEAIAGDIRALYLMLARALHPDKESDPDRRAEKTGWMQKVTAAYAERDLARLLDILAVNPLDAVGPYLSQAPAKTVQGFSKRLRRELELLRARLAALKADLNPFLAGLIRAGRVNEAALNTLVNQARKEWKFRRQRRDAYRTTQGVEGLLHALRVHSWDELM